MNNKNIEFKKTTQYIVCKIEYCCINVRSKMQCFENYAEDL